MRLNYLTHFITYMDYLLLPLYYAMFAFIGLALRNRFYPLGHPWRSYFMPALNVKLLGAIAIGLVYQYYYGYGDTVYYFEQSKTVNSAFVQSPLKWLNLVLQIPKYYDSEYFEFTSQMIWYRTPSNFIVTSFSALFGILCFSKYLPISLFFAALSFSGTWALFRAFARQYPDLIKPIAIACFYIPSTIMWGSGIFKDTLCMFALCWLIYMVFTLFDRRFKLKWYELFLGLLSVWLLFVVKIYILIALLPALALWIILKISNAVPNKLMNYGLRLVLLGIIVVSVNWFSSAFAEEMGKYAIANLSETATVTRDYILSTTRDDGSAYSLGDFSFTPLGIIKVFPLAVNVTLFRPYIWESRKIFVLLNALEASIFLIVFVKLLFVLGIGKFWRAISEDANIKFCLLFTIIFAFSIGVSSGNFGALSRYRIPCLPLFGLSLILIYYRYYATSKKLFYFF